MAKLIVYRGDNPECIEGFSETCKRSCEGALHLRPGQQKTITDDEYTHALAVRPDLKSKIRVVAERPEPVSQPAPEAKVAEPTPAPAEAPQETAKAVEKPKKEFPAKTEQPKNPVV